MASNRMKTNPTLLECSKCGNMAQIQRIQGRERTAGHVKHLWCYKCKERTEHIELGRREALMYI